MYRFACGSTTKNSWVPPPPPAWMTRLLEKKKEKELDCAPNDFVRLLRAARDGVMEDIIAFRHFSGWRDNRGLCVWRDGERERGRRVFVCGVGHVCVEGEGKSGAYVCVGWWARLWCVERGREGGVCLCGVGGMCVCERERTICVVAGRGKRSGRVFVWEACVGGLGGLCVCVLCERTIFVVATCGERFVLCWMVSRFVNVVVGMILEVWWGGGGGGGGRGAGLKLPPVGQEGEGVVRVSPK